MHFWKYLQEVLRDRLVCGIQHEGTQKRLLAEVDMTHKRALEIAQGIEAADKSAQVLKNKDAVLHKVFLQPQPLVPGDTHCYHCGKSNHDP